MTTKFSLATQRTAFDLVCQDARSILQKKCRRGAEADIREWVRVQKSLDREAPDT